MDWNSVLTIIGVNVILYLLYRKQWVKENAEIIHMMQQMLDETKDFHERICKLESKVRER